MCVHVTDKEAEARVKAGPTVTQLVNEEEGCKAGSPLPGPEFRIYKLDRIQHFVRSHYGSILLVVSLILKRPARANQKLRRV